LDGYWILCLLWLRSPAQCPAKSGKAARAVALTPPCGVSMGRPKGRRYDFINFL
jgi:hypothetical protein